LYIFGKDNPLSGSGSFWQHDHTAGRALEPFPSLL
jgi:hypothetical protein